MTQKFFLFSILTACLALSAMFTGGAHLALAGEEAKAGDVTDQELKAAEALKSKTVNKTTKPAIDTSQLVAAPVWEMPHVGEEGSLTSKDLEGKVVLVDFWATWCGPCRKGIPHLKDLYTEYKDEGVEVIGVSLDQKGPAVVRPFMDQYKINYPMVMGNAKVVQDFGGVRGIPTAFIISQDGKIYKKYVGLRTKETYEADIKKLLGKTTS